MLSAIGCCNIVIISLEAPLNILQNFILLHFNDYNFYSFSKFSVALIFFLQTRKKVEKFETAMRMKIYFEAIERGEV